MISILLARIAACATRRSRGRQRADHIFYRIGLFLLASATSVACAGEGPEAFDLGTGSEGLLQFHDTGRPGVDGVIPLPAQDGPAPLTDGTLPRADSGAPPLDGPPLPVHRRGALGQYPRPEILSGSDVTYSASIAFAGGATLAGEGCQGFETLEGLNVQTASNRLLRCWDMFGGDATTGSVTLDPVTVCQ